MNANKPVLTVVGCDPGLANLGLGAVRETGRDVTWLGSELLRTSARRPLQQRLSYLHEGVRTFLSTHRPDALAIEGQYFHQQRETAFKVGQAVGVTLLAAAEFGIEVFEYGPMQVKQTLVGSGRANKGQVLYMVRALLGPDTAGLSHHAGDALALALTHLDRKSTRLNSSHVAISYAVFCLKKKIKKINTLSIKT